MRFVTRSACGASASALRATLADVDGWGTWIPGCLGAAVERQPGGARDVTLVLRAPRQLTVRITVTDEPTGIRYAMVEGDVATVAGAVRVEEEGEGAARICWEQEIVFTVTVPQTLVRELQDETAPRWIQALADAAAQRG